MPLVLKNISKYVWRLSNVRCFSTILSQKLLVNNLKPTCRIFSTRIMLNSDEGNVYVSDCLQSSRHFSKKKGSKRNKEEEESDDEAEEEESDDYSYDVSENVITKSVASMRLDTVIKAGLGMTKKKIETNFYANKFRINNEKIPKKACTVYVGDEIDFIRGFSPENEKFLLVDKLVVKSVGKISGNSLIPLQMEIHKGLTIENYTDPWIPTSTS